AAALDIFLTAKRDATGSTVAALHIYFRLIEEFHFLSISSYPLCSGIQLKKVSLPRAGCLALLDPRAAFAFGALAGDDSLLSLLSRLGQGVVGRNDIHGRLAIAAFGEQHLAVYQREDCVVFAEPDISACRVF